MRRWYQVTLAQIFLLTTLLAIAWWLSANWPMRGIERGPVYYVPKPVYELIEVHRPPTLRRAVLRGTTASVLLVAGFLTVEYLRQKRAVARRHLAD